ncbi:MAG: hypothetical protein HOI47_14760 [Candidatus Scalindua sp.]|jgi:hypothetical protein|nr:hypothetical protein [Candidatus Scalindua sp.]MBT6227904.1 hypothetical protein [Candidatus Scalindua sp.]MBT7349613.1 hypothetical protein [candidate division WWE3 bacterium]
MNKKNYIYILVIVVILSVSACARDIVEEVASAEETAIELAKTCTVVNDETSGLKMNAQEAISTWEKEPEFTPVGWEAIDVDKSVYFVTFHYRVNEIKQLWAFHVALKDGTVEKLELGEDGLDGNRYISRIISTSSYPREKLSVKVKEVFKRLIFQ